MIAVGLVVAVVLAGLLTRGLLALSVTPMRFRWLGYAKWTLVGVLCFMAVTQMFGLFLFLPVFALWRAREEPQPIPEPVYDLDAELQALLELEGHGDV